MSRVSKGDMRCHGDEKEPVFCKETAIKSELEMWFLISESDSLKLDFFICFMGQWWWWWFWWTVLVQKKRIRNGGGLSLGTIFVAEECLSFVTVKGE